MTFQQALAERQWLTMAWPTEYGGLGASFWQQLVMNEEMAYHRAPGAGVNMGVMWVGPALLLYGTDEQKAQHVRGISQAETWWCTLYSEPGAGSDLAAMQTRAVADGDDYVINGQKIWTSGAHRADWGWLAARTDPDAPKHKGLTMFMVDMRSPGITVRPLVNMADGHSFNEVFFEDVRVPKTSVVGEVDRGWYHMAVALDFERSGIRGFARRPPHRGGVRGLCPCASGDAAAPGPACATSSPTGALEVQVGTHSGLSHHRHADARCGGEPRGVGLQALRLGAGAANPGPRVSRCWGPTGCSATRIAPGPPCAGGSRADTCTPSAPPSPPVRARSSAGSSRPGDSVCPVAERTLARPPARPVPSHRAWPGCASLPEAPIRPPEVLRLGAHPLARGSI